MPVTIRPREDGDLPAVVAALRRVHEADAYPLNWPLDPARFLAPDGLQGAWSAVVGSEVAGHVG